MNNFLEGLGLDILSSILASLIIIFFTAIFIKKFGRNFVIFVLNKFLKIEIKNIFKNSHAATDDIYNTLKKANYVDIITGRGLDFHRGKKFKPLFDKKKNYRSIRILLPRISFKPNETDWTNQRYLELVDCGSTGNLKDQIKHTSEILGPYVKENRIQLKCFNMPHIGRIILTERVAYFTPYKSDQDGSESPVFKYGRDDSMYEFLEHLINLLWEFEKCPTNLKCFDICSFKNRGF